VVETALTRVRRDVALLLAAVLVIAFMGGLALTGKPLGGQNFQAFEPHGVVAQLPSDILGVEITHGRDRIAARRAEGGSWALDGPVPAAAPAELVSHLETALRFMHVSAPARTLEAGDYKPEQLADFGLDPPAYVVSLRISGSEAVVADFGSLNVAQTSQYVRLLGQSRLFLLPRHVGAEWQLATDIAQRTALPDVAGRAAGPGGGYLLAASMDQVWAIEIVSGGRLHRFERDSARSWFRHVGQHTHAGGANAHVADPAQAQTIAAALDAFGQTQIETLAARRPSGAELERFGLARPPLLAFLYARDSSTPLVAIEIGSSANQGFSRYARLSQDGDVVTIAGYQAQRLVDLLKATGAAP
jgi:hypothetical protein